MPLEHWQAWGIDHLFRKPVPVSDPLLVKKCFLMSSLNLPWWSFELLPHVLSLDPRKKRSEPLSPCPLLEELQRATRLPLSLLFSEPDKPRALSRSSKDIPPSLFTSQQLVKPVVFQVTLHHVQLWGKANEKQAQAEE